MTVTSHTPVVLLDTRNATAAKKLITILLHILRHYNICPAIEKALKERMSRVIAMEMIRHLVCSHWCKLAGFQNAADWHIASSCKF